MNTPNRSRPVTIVTGGSRGIGAAICERLAGEGHAVVINYAGSHQQAQALVARLVEHGGEAIAVQGDVADPAAVQRLFDAAQERFGGIDVLVNNAGVMTLAPVVAFADDDFDRQIAINLKGSFNAMREAARRLREGGRIVNFSSSVIGLRLEQYGAYSATKAAVEALTSVLSRELRGRSITVNAVAPGPTATALFLDGKPQEVVDRMAKMNPLERLGTPEDIAAVVSFLVGPQGGWVNGQVLRANGGMV
ncbi:SDR family oxidoreductase [Xanthomonas maliensis]|uniref:SDR family oxidoreductase n=1 Tax=Xanthomonas maliensis TaxID=1321368 RepID=UPI0003A266D7|nr:SDR family oxidoreductase [Xanthomonas maliensis]KAB7767057.1 3-ketoacyl-ACP reductase [Xanthomonas maliensis]